MQKPPSSPHQRVPKAAGRRTHTLKHFRGGAEGMKMMRRWQRDGGCEATQMDTREARHFSDTIEMIMERRMEFMNWPETVVFVITWHKHYYLHLLSLMSHFLSSIDHWGPEEGLLSVKCTLFKQTLFIWSGLQMKTSTGNNWYIFCVQDIHVFH